MRPHPRFFNCENCPSYCCSYEAIEVKPEDIIRLAFHFAMDLETASRRLTMEGVEPSTRVMRHFRDPVYGTVCRLLDVRSRRCLAYDARPNACRNFPDTPSCHYYQFLMTERRKQGRPALAVRAYNVL